MFRTLLYGCLLNILIPSLVLALDKSMSIFYPLPIQEQGKVIVAQNLYLGSDGGIWVHDVHGKVMYFDGQNVLPRRGSVLPQLSSHIVYANSAFWAFEQHELFRTYPGGERELMLSLTPGTQIIQMGASNGMIWMVDGENFYSYEIRSGRVESLSLHELYQLNSASKVVINDAQFLVSKWALATNVGVYLSDEQGFSHVKKSGKHFVQKLYFSHKRRELLVGSKRGALIIDIENKRSLPDRIGSSHVLSMAETEKEYWVGTEEGLYVYSFITGKIVQLESNSNNNNEYALLGKKIYAMVNDFQGGMWIATDKGVFYYSLFGQQFTRYPTQALSNDGSKAQISKIKALNSDGDYLAITQQGLYNFNVADDLRKHLIYPGKVNDFAINGENIWIATDKGLARYNLSRRSIDTPHLPLALLQTPVEHLTIDGSGNLWGSSNHQIWSYSIIQQSFVDYGSEWMVKQYSPSRITLLAAVEQGIVIGTEHGAYSLFGKQIRFDFSSHRYGEIVQVAQNALGDVWIIGAYGVFLWHQDQPEAVPVELIEENIQPLCIAESKQGMWFISSQGISHYSDQGQLNKNFSAPYGLISHEFLPASCAVGEEKESSSLVIGSQLGIVKVNTEELAVSNLPNIQVMFSQVSVNHRPKLLGYRTPHPLKIRYGDAISFQFGALPSARSQSLEYKLNDDQQWQRFDGALLNFDQLLPGKYRLKVRSANPMQRYRTEALFDFEVSEPWYMTSMALVGYVLSLLGLLALALWWRTRMILAANRKLKAQVELKTSQLRHQSKIVLSNNHQLRKQLQLHHTILGSVLNNIDASLRHLSSYAKVRSWSEFEAPFNKVKQELAQLHFMHRGDEDESKYHDLHLLIESALKSWHEEYSKALIKLTYSGEPRFVEVRQFNLDVLFNAVLTDAIKRLYKHQELTIQLEVRNAQAVIVFSDFGAPIQNIDKTMVTLSGSSYPLEELVTRSGGVLHVLALKERNVIELAWPLATLPELETIHKPEEGEQAAKVGIDEVEKEWLSKVEKLIELHYSDPNFTTSTAAQALYVSERSLQRRFKAATGKTFKESLNEVRLEKACQSLLSGAKIAQVAFDCGFNDPSYFSQRFKHHFGLSPSQFIEDQEN
ncbi:transcriptional regulator, AraC/XylS family [Vibrio cholerae]|uniref:AraC family transcriptional regulator n=1 Tax=Vibrio cholerae TaxID=666 RepID=UPI0016524120|nr:AraC family transcriptional regulator [Vibrio cholerae]GHX88908.1 transcriptional regulator, AraC/XylS family [Vibrio cholerae]